jgi:threonine/homoserine/homoserine lactone efflux protein
MTWDSVLIFAAAVGALAIKPGAGMMMVMSRTLSQGMSACLAFALGFVLISVLFLGLVFFGYKFVEVDLIFISILIKSLSAVYLIWLGIKGLQALEDKYHIEQMKVESFFDNLSASIMLTLSNPLTIVFYAGIVPTLVNVKDVSLSDFGIMALVIAVVEFVVAIGYSLPLLWYRKKVNADFLRQLKFFSSIVIILVGLYIGYTAISSDALLSVF